MGEKGEGSGGKGEGTGGKGGGNWELGTPLSTPSILVEFLLGAWKTGNCSFSGITHIFHKHYFNRLQVIRQLNMAFTSCNTL